MANLHNMAMIHIRICEYMFNNLERILMISPLGIVTAQVAYPRVRIIQIREYVCSASVIDINDFRVT